MIQRGSTTAIPFDIYGTPLEGISEIYAAFVQKGRPIAEKTYSAINAVKVDGYTVKKDDSGYYIEV